MTQPDPFRANDHISLHFAGDYSDSPLEIRVLDSVREDYDPFDSLTTLQRRTMAVRLRHWADQIDVRRLRPEDF